MPVFLSEDLLANLTAEMVATILSKTPEPSTFDPSMGVTPDSFRNMIKALVETEVRPVKLITKLSNMIYFFNFHCVSEIFRTIILSFI